MDVKELISCIEGIAPLSAQAPWDRSGTQVAGVGNTVSRLAVSLDPTPGACRAALDWKADFLLTHHPLYLEPRALDTPGPFLDSARLLLSAGVWCYAAHTSLDANPAGPAGWLARELGLRETRVLEPTAEGYGFGQAGLLPAALEWEEFCARLAALAQRPWLTLAGTPPQRVASVAVCPGSGGSLLGAALAAGAQVLVTGDLKYHQALDSAGLGLCVADVGHFSLEEEMTRRLAGELAATLEGRGVSVRFFPGQEPFALRPTTRPA